MKNKKVILYILAFSLTLSMFIFPAHAVDVYETENNNTVTNADVTYDDYNNYGAISSATDVDWWTITVTQTGSANFWMGNVPSGCHYNLYLYEFDGEVLIAQATDAEDGQLINARVYAGVTYTIKIASTGGFSSANYIFRIKNYTDARKARYFTFYDDKAKEESKRINFQAGFHACSAMINSMGYTTGNSYEFTGKQVYENMPNYDLVHVESHAEPGKMFCGGSSYLYGSTVVYDANINQGMANYSYGALTKVKLLILMGCETGLSDGILGNLVDSANNKNAFCVLGWNIKLRAINAVPWQETFYDQLSYGVSVAEALAETAAIMEETTEYHAEVNDIKGKDVNTESLTLC